MIGKLSIYQILENAAFNLTQGYATATGINQLNNAIALIDKGYPIHEEIDLTPYEDVDEVPDYAEK